jgi:hypothetical protein
MEPPLQCPHCTVNTDLTCQIRQKGGIGSTAYDEKQQDIMKAFFGGKTEDSDLSAHDRVTDQEHIIE